MRRRAGLPDRIGLRFAFVLAVAMLPLAVISAMQATALLDETRARSEAALLGATRAAAAPDLRAIERASGAAEALAQAVRGMADDVAACTTMMQNLVQHSGIFSYASHFDAAGRVVCASTGGVHDFGVTPARLEAIRDPKPRVRINRAAPISGTSVLYAEHPVLNDAGVVVGFTSVSVPHAALSAEGTAKGGPQPLSIMTFNGEGALVTASGGLEGAEAELPRHLTLAEMATRPPQTFTDESRAGPVRAFSVVPVVPGTLYALGSWPAAELPGAIGWTALPPYAFPALMWLVSLIVATIAADRLMARHVKALTRAITSFAGGSRLSGPLRLHEAPGEIREAGAAFELMRESILRDEAEMENLLHQQEVLLREVHHRVKNNLQLIASIMNMQIRRTRNPEVRQVVRRLQERVMSLAAIHRGLYQTSGLADVQVDELLREILGQMLSMASAPERRFDVSVDLTPMRLTPDQAVPLALLLSEALTNAMKYAADGAGGRGRLRVALRPVEGGAAELTVVNALADGALPDEAGTGTGLGTQLVDAFVQQLGGTVERATEAGDYALRVVFPVQKLRPQHDAPPGPPPADTTA
jgi:two-component sensor histidine kinase